MHGERGSKGNGVVSSVLAWVVKLGLVDEVRDYKISSSLLDLRQSDEN